MGRPYISNGMNQPVNNVWHGTTILCLRKAGQVVVAGDGQVTMGQMVVKSNARKLRRQSTQWALVPHAGEMPSTFLTSQIFEEHLIATARRQRFKHLNGWLL